MTHRNLPLLVQHPPLDPNLTTWATVTQFAPVRIKIDGETTALPFAPESLVTNLLLGDRVLVLLASNSDPVTRARRVIVLGKSAASTATMLGEVKMYAGATAPAGWNLCDGTEASRTSFAGLYAVIGTTYGVGDGVNTFNLPNMKGRVAVGRDAAQAEFDVMGEVGGEKTHTMSIPEMPSHSHTGTTGSSFAYNTQNIYQAGGATNLFALSWGGTFVGVDANYQAKTAHTHAIPLDGSGVPFNVLQPYLVMNYIIRVQ